MCGELQGGYRDTCAVFPAVDEEQSTICGETQAGATGRQGASDDVGEVGPLKSDWVEVVEVVHEWCWEKMGDKRK